MALRNLVFREEPGMLVGSCKHWALARSPLKQMLAGREGPQCQTACALLVVLGCKGESCTRVLRALSEKHWETPKGFNLD